MINIIGHSDDLVVDEGKQANFSVFVSLSKYNPVLLLGLIKDNVQIDQTEYNERLYSFDSSENATVKRLTFTILNATLADSGVYSFYVYTVLNVSNNVNISLNVRRE